MRMKADRGDIDMVLEDVTELYDIQFQRGSDTT